MRALGELVSILVVFGIAMAYLNRKYLRPLHHRRHMAALERESNELDQQLHNMTHPIDIESRRKQ